MVHLYKAIRRAHEEGLVKAHRHDLETAATIIDKWIKKSESVIAAG